MKWSTSWFKVSAWTFNFFSVPIPKYRLIRKRKNGTFNLSIINSWISSKATENVAFGLFNELKSTPKAILAMESIVKRFKISWASKISPDFSYFSRILNTLVISNNLEWRVTNTRVELHHVQETFAPSFLLEPLSRTCEMQLSVRISTFLHQQQRSHPQRVHPRAFWSAGHPFWCISQIHLSTCIGLTPKCKDEGWLAYQGKRECGVVWDEEEPLRQSHLRTVWCHNAE